MWLEELTGLDERRCAGPDDVAAAFEVHRGALGGDVIVGPNGRPLRVGRFEMLSLEALREASFGAGGGGGSTTVREVVADVTELHLDPANAGAAFQVASQFNTLEMSAPSITPEDGIERYEHDPTQGPACAIACGAGTIHRNYLVDLRGEPGQRAHRQIDGLAPIAAALDIAVDMRNGYAFPSPAQLDRVAAALDAVDDSERNQLLGLLEVGVMWNTEVTLAGGGHSVTQVYCSALPVGYSRHRDANWQPFAQVVLDAAYEATLAVAAINAEQTAHPTVFLTMLGGGVFENDPGWIADAIERSVDVRRSSGLDVALVSHRAPNPAISHLL